jgi:hypothetical protein
MCPGAQTWVHVYERVVALVSTCGTDGSRLRIKIRVSEENNRNPVVWLSGHRRRDAFGLALERVFEEHGIAGQEDMARVIREGGYHRTIPQNTISNWMGGTSEPERPWKLAAALEEVLPMTEKQWTYLSLAYFAPREYLRRYHPAL